jgi:hypothetical protein
MSRLSWKWRARSFVKKRRCDRSSRVFRKKKPATTKPRLGASSPARCSQRESSGSGDATRAVPRGQEPESRNPLADAIAAARIETAGKDVAHSPSGIATLKELAAIIAKSRELHYQGIELDARLALAEIEMKAGQKTAGRAHPAAVEADAKAKGYTSSHAKLPSLAAEFSAENQG